MLFGIPVYEGVDLLDVTGPHEMFGWLPAAGFKAEVRILAQTLDEVSSRDGFTFRPQARFADIDRLDVLWVPGGDPGALRRLMTGPDRTYLDFLVRISGTARYVASVCEGALLLAQAGLLDGYRVTTHWAFIPCLKRFPAIEVAEGTPRFVVDRNRVTGGGISSGLDQALGLIELLAGRDAAEAVQRTTQYYPKPPVQGSLPEALSCPFSW